MAPRRLLAAECPVCLEDMDDDGAALCACHRCRNTLHLACALLCEGRCPICRYTRHERRRADDDVAVARGAVVTLQAAARRMRVYRRMWPRRR